LCYEIALRITENRFDAQDVVQVVFCKIWAMRPALRHNRLKSWLAAVTRNAALDFQRKVETDRRYLKCSYEDRAYDRTAEEEALVNLDSGRVTVYLRALPTEIRSLIHESFFERSSHSSIARRRRLPLGTVKSRIRSGLSSLREMMDAEPERGNSELVRKIV
jgi:RNA polymerase sigma-70 factor, ECF subfamily